MNAHNPPPFLAQALETFQTLAAQPLSLLQDGLLDRLVLVLNHLLLAEPEATRRLQQHVGKSVHLQFEDWPALLPQPPELRWRVTPAGLLERLDAQAWEQLDASSQLQATVRLPQPVMVMAGPAALKPQVAVQGDAALAAEVAWLMENVRWDAAHDLRQWLGEGPGRTLQQVMSQAGPALKQALQTLAATLEQWRPGR